MEVLDWRGSVPPLVLIECYLTARSRVSLCRHLGQPNPSFNPIGSTMTTIAKDADLIRFINVFTVDPPIGHGSSSFSPG
jgi:hypothetical protein